MAATRTYCSPDYTGPSADAAAAERDARVTLAAGYRRDREEIQDFAAAAVASPGDLDTVAIARLGHALFVLDTLVLEHEDDARTIAALQRQVAERTAELDRARTLLADARDQLQALTLEIEAARADDLTAAMNRTSAHLGKTMAEAEAAEEQRIEDAAEADRYRRVAVRHMARLREQGPARGSQPAEYTLDDETVVPPALELFV